jgi:hypothetical protein
MRLAQFSLVLTALVFGGFGTWLLLWPQALSKLGVELTTPAARTEIRAFYGGLELGFAFFFAIAATRPHWYEAALFAQAASLGAAAMARLFGLVVDGGAGPTMLVLLAAESAGSFLGIVALVRLRRQESSPTTLRG